MRCLYRPACVLNKLSVLYNISVQLIVLNSIMYHVWKCSDFRYLRLHRFMQLNSKQVNTQYIVYIVLRFDFLWKRKFIHSFCFHLKASVISGVVCLYTIAYMCSEVFNNSVSLVIIFTDEKFRAINSWNYRSKTININKTSSYIVVQ